MGLTSKLVPLIHSLAVSRLICRCAFALRERDTVGPGSACVPESTLIQPCRGSVQFAGETSGRALRREARRIYIRASTRSRTIRIAAARKMAQVGKRRLGSGFFSGRLRLR